MYCDFLNPDYWDCLTVHFYNGVIGYSITHATAIIRWDVEGGFEFVTPLPEP